jgi:hypothetical protein
MRTLICGASTCFSISRSAMPGIPWPALLQRIGLGAQVSRSSPKILIAICARTPDSMWSMRCEIGWPRLRLPGRSFRRARMSA